MTKIFEGSIFGEKMRIAIIGTRWNEFIVERLITGAKSAARRCGVLAENIDLAIAPGAYEVPFIAKKLADCGRYDAIVALGCVIRGETSHFEYVAAEAATGIARIACDTGTPVSFGILTVETTEQAIERAGAKSGNKGEEAMLAAIETFNLAQSIKEDG